MSINAFAFISSGLGSADYRRRADGRRYRISLADPERYPATTDGLAPPADLLAEWRAYRLAERAEFDRWTERLVRRGGDPYAAAEVRADNYPDLTDEPEHQDDDPDPCASCGRPPALCPC